MNEYNWRTLYAAAAKIKSIKSQHTKVIFPKRNQGKNYAQEDRNNNLKK